MDELDQKVIPEGAMDVMGHAIDRILTPEQAWKLYGLVHAGGSAPRVNPGLNNSHSLMLSETALHDAESGGNINTCVINAIRMKKVRDAFKDAVAERRRWES